MLVGASKVVALYIYIPLTFARTHIIVIQVHWYIPDKLNHISSASTIRQNSERDLKCGK